MSASFVEVPHQQAEDHIRSVYVRVPPVCEMWFYCEAEDVDALYEAIDAIVEQHHINPYYEFGSSDGTAYQVYLGKPMPEFVQLRMF